MVNQIVDRAVELEWPLAVCGLVFAVWFSRFGFRGFVAPGGWQSELIQQRNISMCLTASTHSHEVLLQGHRAIVFYRDELRARSAEGSSLRKSESWEVFFWVVPENLKAKWEVLAFFRGLVDLRGGYGPPLSSPLVFSKKSLRSSTGIHLCRICSSGTIVNSTHSDKVIDF